MKALVLLTLLASGSGAYAQSAISPPETDIQGLLDSVWVIIAAVLVMLMQIGFLLLEAGMVRSKNSINVAMKNVMDFCVSTLAFAAVGFMLAFGASSILAVGWDMQMIGLNDLDARGIIFFIFQAMFCGTAATIVSGGVAERMRLSAYTLGSLFIGGLIYPIFVHWSWGAALGPNDGAFLGNMGFVDFAGSTVVHATGGWLTLAACLILGSRSGRFQNDGKPVRFSGHSAVLASTGAIFLFVGWIGFNGGSTIKADMSIGPIIAATLLAGSAGTVAGYIWTMTRDRAVLPEKVLCGMIGGLVAVTAGCAILSPGSAIIVGLIGGVVSNGLNHLLERYLKVDDAVGAIGTHAGAGVVGTLLLAFLAPEASLPLANRWDQFLVQLTGVGLNFVWAFGSGLAFFYLLRESMGIRVADGAEERGLNESEHDTRIGIGHVEEAMDELVRGTADLNVRLPVDAGDEAERLILTFNALLDNLQQIEHERSEARDAQRAVEEAERLSALADATFEALCLSVGDIIVDGNAALSRLLNMPLEEIMDRPLTDFFRHDDMGVLDNLSRSEVSSTCDLNILDKKGQIIPVEVRGRNIVLRGRVTRVLAIVDVRERRKAEERIRYLAQHDPLTGLPNRALFNDRLGHMIDRTVKQGTLSAVVLIDLDRFKDVNDLYGHAAGDEVLKVTSERLMASVGPRDTVARLGGDEFAILQIGITFANQARDLALRLVHDLNQSILLPDGVKVSVGASVGIALCPRDGIEDVGLITRADTALYHAKSQGRNRYAMFEAGMDDHVRHRQLLELDIAIALENEQFEVHYQPRLDTKTGEIASYEALLRWEHPSRGKVSPADFIPVAEGCGQIIKIGKWVLRRACVDAASGASQGRVSVNASPLQFRDRNFIETVRDALEFSGLAPERLEIEITESVLIDDDQRALKVFSRLKELGVKIALDDFGTGYSSLGYLSRFPFDTIKIDRSFVQGLKDSENGHEIIGTIIRLGRALNMNIVAEGVETVDAFAALVEFGCDEIQGYLVGAAVPIAQLQREAPDYVARLLTHEVRIEALQKAAETMRGNSRPGQFASVASSG
ncbi:MAG: diguanylate cyclase [Ponticaulis sp.]|nr:diguanylate cyclase [Ponticaulis sp.]